MSTPPDLVSIGLRTLLLAATFQAAGAYLLRLTSETQLAHCIALLQRLGRVAVLATLLLLLAHQAVEAARLAGDFSGLFDPGLQSTAWRTRLAGLHAVQALGAALLWRGFGPRGRLNSAAGSLGLILLLGAFTLAGHTRLSPQRAWLAPLLVLHVLGAAYWFGALLPLFVACRRLTATQAAALLKRFSVFAGGLVPLLALAGLVMAWMLTGGDTSALQRPYGMLLLGKTLLVAILLWLAARNRWQLTPAMARGSMPAVQAMRKVIAIELLLIFAVLAITATMTALFSPE